MVSRQHVAILSSNLRSDKPASRSLESMPITQIYDALETRPEGLSDVVFLSSRSHAFMDAVPLCVLLITPFLGVLCLKLGPHLLRTRYQSCRLVSQAVRFLLDSDTLREGCVLE